MDAPELPQSTGTLHPGVRGSHLACKEKPNRFH